MKGVHIVFLFSLISTFTVHNSLCAQATNKIDSIGNVGIGILSPSQSLEVEKNIDGATFMLLRNNTSATSAFSGLRAISQNQNITLMATSDGFTRGDPGYHPAAVSVFGSSSNGLNIISAIGDGLVGANTGKIRCITTVCRRECLRERQHLSLRIY
jgi:hypothetical protein